VAFINRYFKTLKEVASAIRSYPDTSNRALRNLTAYCRGFCYAEQWSASASHCPTSAAEPPLISNPLRKYFSNHSEGHGIWKWEHYFEIYHQHFARFVGSAVDVLEIGIYSGGSLDMWASYFGDKCHIYGVDIKEACRAYARDNISVFIGDQQDRSFWAEFKNKVNGIDILIDDGGHTWEQQTTTLEEMLPYLRPGGVYLCEDVHGIHHRFAAFAAGLVSQINQHHVIPGRILRAQPTAFQGCIHSIHFYPYIIVIEKTDVPRTEFAAPKRGTMWQPFL
jgi:hypothetical protein